MKRIMTGILALMLSLCLCCLAGAESASAAQDGTGNTPVIQDDADLLTQEEESRLYEFMSTLCGETTPLLWTTYEIGDYERLSEDFLHQHVGRGGNGVVLTINMYARQLIISADGAAYRVVTRSEAETITDNIFRAARDGRYADAAMSAFQQIRLLFQGSRISRPMKLVSNVLLALVLALLCTYLYISSKYENRPKIGKVGAALPVTAAAAAGFAAVTANAVSRMTKQKKINISSGSGGGGSHGGGGGFSGGGSSGGSGSHGF